MMRNESIGRRRFLRDAVFGAGALAAGGRLRGQATGSATTTPPKRWKTAVGLNGFESVRSYGYKMQLDEVLEFIRVCGFDGVELVDWPKPYPRTAEEARALKARYDRLGLEIMSL